LRSCSSPSIRLRSGVIPMNSFVHWFTAAAVRNPAGALLPLAAQFKQRLRKVAGMASSY
jgi:hypothetical protein